jgi:GNAT superfamily N-acetyltransferase
MSEKKKLTNQVSDPQVSDPASPLKSTETDESPTTNPKSVEVTDRFYNLREWKRSAKALKLPIFDAGPMAGTRGVKSYFAGNPESSAGGRFDAGPGWDYGHITRTVTEKVLEKERPSSAKSSKTSGTKNQTDMFQTDMASKKSTITRIRTLSSKGVPEKVKLGNVNSAGQRITATKQGMENFWNWFNESAVCTDDGRPLLLYHSTNADIEVLKAGQKTRNNYGFLGDVETSRAGIFASPELEFSQEYLRDGSGQNVMPVYMSLQQPFDTRQGISWQQEEELVAAGISSRWLYDYRNHDWEMYDNDEEGKNRFVEVLKELGYDGAIFHEEGLDKKIHTTYMAFDSSSIKSALGNRGTWSAQSDQILFSTRDDASDKQGDKSSDAATVPLIARAPSTLFYSSLRRQIEAASTRQASAQDWINFLGTLNQKGVKSEEIEWSGILDWLQMEKDEQNIAKTASDKAAKKITKDALLGYLEENSVRVNEVDLSDDGWSVVDQATGGATYRASFESKEQAQAHLVQKGDGEFGVIANSDAPGANTKYSKYTLAGGENYREILLTIPMAKELANVTQMKRRREVFLELKTDYEAEGMMELAAKTQQKIDALSANIDAAKGPVNHKIRANHKSHHWDQSNVIAHIRLNDRIDANGERVLFVEEIQSDFAQEGKKSGFAQNYQAQDLSLQSQTETMWEIAAKEPAGRKTANQPVNESGYDQLFQIAKSKVSTAEAAMEYIVREKIYGGSVPRAPFVEKTQSWLSLALKRVIGMAVDEGYDKVAFSTGAQNVERFQLAKKIDQLRLQWARAERDTVNLEAYDSNGKVVLAKRDTPRLDIASHIGKAAATRALEDLAKYGQVDLKNLDLPIGGEGMLAFYDQIIPNTLASILKKLGGSPIESVNLAQKAQPGKIQPGFAITDALAANVAQGMPLFSTRNPSTLSQTSKSTLESHDLTEWFGSSKVTDAQGEPLTVYHGSNTPNIFDFNTGIESNPGERGTFFSASKTAAQSYGEYLYEANLKMENPLEVDSRQWAAGAGPSPVEARSMGYDGYIIRGMDGQGGDAFIAFESSQIRQTKPVQVQNKDGSGQINGAFEVRGADGSTTRFATLKEAQAFRMRASQTPRTEASVQPSLNKTIDSAEPTEQFNAAIRSEHFTREEGLSYDIYAKKGIVKIDAIDVAPAFRFRGIASRLLDRVIVLADQSGLPIELEVGSDTEENQKNEEISSINDLPSFYAKWGFVWREGYMRREPVSENQSETQSQNLYSARQLGLYSELLVQIESSSMQKAPPDEWAAYIRGLSKKGVKADEIEWSGVLDWLSLKAIKPSSQDGTDSNTGGDAAEKVSKSDLLDYLDANGVQIDELVLGDKSPRTVRIEYTKAMRDQGVDASRAEDIYDEMRKFADNEKDYNEELKDEGFELVMASGGFTGNEIHEAQSSATNTKYSQHTLPGAENYREVLLTLPSRDVSEDLKGNKEGKPFKSQHWDQENVLAHIRINDRFTKSYTDESISDIEQRILSCFKQPAPLASSLGSGSTGMAVRKGAITPLEAAQYSHVRGFLNDTTGAQKKILFIEEIQSDWSQKGRKHGFDPVAGVPPELVVQEIGAGWEVYNKSMGRTAQDEDGNDAIFTTEKDALAMREQLLKVPYESASGVPAGPFVTTTDAWLNLCIKRIMKMAVDGDYDQVAFITGEQSVERYDLSKSIVQISASKNEDASIQVFLRDSQGVNTNAGSFEPHGAALEKLVGAELAKAISSQTKPYDIYDGSGLQVGGEGMNTFYGLIVPNAVNNMLKKLGAKKLSQIEISQDSDASNADLKAWNYDAAVKVLSRGAEVYISSRSGESRVKSKEDLDEQLDELEESADRPYGFYLGDRQGKSLQPGFQVDDEIREKIKSGLPLFSFRDVESQGQSQLQDEEVDEPTSSTPGLPEFISDIPNEDWLNEKIEYASSRPRNTFGVPAMASITGYFDGSRITVPTEMAAALKGMRAEQSNVRQGDLQAITDIMRSTGKLPLTQANEEYLPYIEVGHDGVAWVSEGNHRIMAAAALGWESIPVQIRYFDGGQRHAGQWAPGNLLRLNEQLLNKSANTDSREADEAAQTKSPAFKAWFEGSKVTDSQGEPLVVYHGTGESFDAFDPEKIGLNFDSSTLGFYFTNAPKVDIKAGIGFGSTASEYASNAAGNANVMPVFLSLKNPLVIDDCDQWGGAALALDKQRSDIARWAENGGHDGVIAYDKKGESPEKIFVAFSPTQIKSAIGNNGDFDGANPDIRYSNRDQVENQAARAAGFDTSITYYHGTTARDFKGFNAGRNGVDELGPGIYLTSDASYAQAWAGRPGMLGRIIPALLKKGDLFDKSSPVDYLALARRIQEQNTATEGERQAKNIREKSVTQWTQEESHIVNAASNELWRTWLLEPAKDLAAHIKRSDLNLWLARAGYVGATNKNSQIPGQVVVFEGKNLRSPWAKFNPKKADSNNLLYSAQPDQTLTPAFKAWFEGSKVTDSQGEPLVMYHGTMNSFSTFDSDMGYGDADYFFTSPDPDQAFEFARVRADGIAYEEDEIAAGPSVMPLYISAKNPFDYENQQQVNALAEELKSSGNFGDVTLTELRGIFSEGDWRQLEAEGVQDAIKQLGHDGFFAKERGIKNLAVYSPTQIKSVLGNNGDFDAQNEDIRYSTQLFISQPDSSSITLELIREILGDKELRRIAEKFEGQLQLTPESHLLGADWLGGDKAITPEEKLALIRSAPIENLCKLQIDAHTYFSDQDESAALLGAGIDGAHYAKRDGLTLTAHYAQFEPTSDTQEGDRLTRQSGSQAGKSPQVNNLPLRSTVEKVRQAVTSLTGAQGLTLNEQLGRLVITTSEELGRLSGSGLVKVLPQFASNTLFSLAKSQTLKDILSEGRLAHFRAISSIGEVGECAIVRSASGRAQWKMILRDASEPGKWRTQSFDERGFSGHKSFDTQELAIKDAAETGFSVRDDGALDRIQDSHQFQRGIFVTDLIARVNAGKLKQKDGDELLAQYDAAAKVLQSVAQSGAQAFITAGGESIYLLADRIDEGSEKAVFLHEIVHRYGRSLLGKDAWLELNKTLKGWSTLPYSSLERQIYNKANRRAETAAGGKEFIRQEELFAYSVEEAVNHKVVPSAVALEGSAEKWLDCVVESLQMVVRSACKNQEKDDTEGEIQVGPGLESMSAQQLVDLAYALAQLDSPQRSAQIEGRLTDAEKAALNHLFEKSMNLQKDADGQDGKVRSIVKSGSSASSLTSSHEFKKWSENLNLIRSNEASTYLGGPVVFESFHGTTHTNILKFEERGNHEGFLGAGPYFTTSALDASENYAGIGPDLTARIDNERENRSYDLDDYGMQDMLRNFYDANAHIEPVEGWDEENTDEAWQEHGYEALDFDVRSSLKGDSDGFMMKVFVKMTNPADTTGATSNGLTYEVISDGDGDIIDEQGTLVDWILATRRVCDGLGIRADDCVDRLLTEACDGHVGMDEVFRLSLKHLNEAHDDEGNLLSAGAIFKEIAKEVGYDGIIMDADMHFGSGRRGFGGIKIPSMKGVKEGTLHLVPFSPTQVKSALGNNGEFDSENPDIRYSLPPSLVPSSAVESSHTAREFAKAIKPHKEAIYNALIGHAGCGPFDGGCVVFAKALQQAIGGQVVVVTNRFGRGDHAAVELNGKLYDFDGPLSPKAFMARFEKNERVIITGYRPMQDSDLKDAYRGKELESKLAGMLRQALTPEQSLKDDETESIGEDLDRSHLKQKC